MKTLDVVALQCEVPEKELRRGQVGTLVEDLGDGVFEVEFSDDAGKPYAFASLKSEDLLKLVHTPQAEVV